MNDFSDLEAELKLLRPVSPSAELISRVERSLGESASTAAVAATTATAGVLPSPRKAGFNWFAFGLGLAAATALLMLARTNVDRVPHKSPTVASSQSRTLPAKAAPVRSMVPDGLTRVVYAQSDEGLVFPSYADTPLRRVRSRSREILQWKDPGTGDSLRVSYPTEEVELIPVSGQ
jgi:hypothetical protein